MENPESLAQLRREDRAGFELVDISPFSTICGQHSKHMTEWTSKYKLLKVESKKIYF